jgi:beta-xylosidase
MNPFLDNQDYIPDPEAHVWDDGRLYVYGSLDIRGAEYWCSDQYRVFSTADLVHWTDHGVSLEKEPIPFRTKGTLCAPDCICKDGKYYLYFCMHGLGGREGVAVSDRPEGPFRNPVQIEHTAQIDPAAFVDDDGKAYFYWGQMEAKGAELNEDMLSIQPDTVRTLLTHEEDGFIEASSMRKINGRYYLVYSDTSRGLGTCLSYAISDSPLGPFEKKGVIIDNVGCDPFSWNNHGSLCEFKGQWYIFYHRSSLGTRWNRRACAEPVTIHPDGTIDEVEMTTQGTEPPIDASREMEAWRACYVYGGVHTAMEGETEILHAPKKYGFADYRYLQFSGQKTFNIRVKGSGSLNVHLDNPFWLPAVTLEFDSPDHWTTVDCDFPETEGKHSVHLTFNDDGISVQCFAFDILND